MSSWWLFLHHCFLSQAFESGTCGFEKNEGRPSADTCAHPPSILFCCFYATHQCFSRALAISFVLFVIQVLFGLNARQKECSGPRLVYALWLSAHSGERRWSARFGQFMNTFYRCWRGSRVCIHKPDGGNVRQKGLAETTTNRNDTQETSGRRAGRSRH